ncbi:MAG: hypothetical protein AAFV53_33925 [Myxococcota bacterium]
MTADHNPEVRTVVHEERGWQVLVHPRNGDGYHHRVAEGRLHLQMWHPKRSVSVLLPSVETDNRYEIFSKRHPTVRLNTYPDVCEELESAYNLKGLCSDRLCEFRIWFVLSAQIGATQPNVWSRPVPCCQD